MREEKHFDTSDRFYLEDNDTCIGMEDYISYDEGVLVCSFEGTPENPQVIKYWYEEHSNVKNLTRCPLTRKQFIYTYVKDIPTADLAGMKSDHKLITDNSTLKAFLVEKHHELEWSNPNPESDFGRHFNTAADTADQLRIIGLVRDLLLWLKLRQNFLHAHSMVRLKLIAAAFVNLLKFLYELPVNLIIVAGLSIVSAALMIAGAVTLNLNWFALGLLGAVVTPVFVGITLIERLAITFYTCAYTLSLPISFIVDAVKSISGSIHQKIRNAHVNEVAGARVSPQALSNDDIDKIVSNYHSQFRKRHPTLTSIFTLGFFATQQSHSSAALVGKLQQGSLSLQEKRRAISDYLVQPKNRGKSLWASIHNSQAEDKGVALPAPASV